MEPPEVRGASYENALESLDQLLQTNNPNIRTYNAAIEAHLSLGVTELQLAHVLGAERDFASAAALAKQILTQDPEDFQERRELAVALRRAALIPAIEGRIAKSNVLREQATEVLRSTIRVPESNGWDEAANSSCSETIERFSEGQSPMPLGHGDLLIGNGSAGGNPGKLLVFSPAARELSVLAEGGYLADMVDVAYASRTELYVVDRSLAGSGGIVRLRYQAGRWLQKPITCGGLLRRPTAVAYHDKHLILADADEYSARLVGVDLQTGRQTLLGRTGTFAEPGKIVHYGVGDYFVSLFWPGEGGPAEIVRFNADTHKLVVAARYGLLQDPVALAITPRGDLIAGDRGWVANRGHGDVFRIGSGGAQKVICGNPELSRVTAIAVASDREAWYVTAAAPFSPASLFELDLLTGHWKQIMSGGLLGAPRALAHVD
jgi:tetratricopeptide (TPR) repeat protein